MCGIVCIECGGVSVRVWGGCCVHFQSVSGICENYLIVVCGVVSICGGEVFVCMYVGGVFVCM